MEVLCDLHTVGVPMVRPLDEASQVIVGQVESPEVCRHLLWTSVARFYILHCGFSEGQCCQRGMVAECRCDLHYCLRANHVSADVELEEPAEIWDGSGYCYAACPMDVVVL